MHIPRGRLYILGLLLLAQVGAFDTPPAAAKSEKRQRISGVVLTAERMSVLRQVNSHVNSTVSEVSDLEQYGREDVWTLPTSGKGDCEDFALLKRKLLVDSGWPASTLLVTAVQTAEGEPHAVLMARTDQGDYALDNKTSEIRPFTATGYTMLSQQSQAGAGKWIAAGTGANADGPVADFPVR